MVIEIFHSMKQCKGRKTFWGVLKVDIYKAYDSLPWEVLDAVLHKMKFLAIWTVD